VGADSALERPNQTSTWTLFPLLLDAGSCPVCATDRLQPLHVYPNTKRSVSAALNLALLGCESCGVVFSHPLPSDDDLDKYYGGKAGWESRLPENEAKIERRLEVKQARHSRHLAALETVIRRDKNDGRPPKAFDFGCGLGAWLDVLKARGWDTYGLEPGERARTIAARAHTIVTAIPADVEFDLIIVNHVLEHLRDPLAVTRALAAATTQGGHIYVSVPDFGRLPDHCSFGYVKNERHVFSYTSSSLRSLFALSGFELVAHSNDATWPGEPVDKNDAKGLKAVGVRVPRELALAPNPLAEAIASMRGYEPHAAERLVESLEQPTPPVNHPPSKVRASAARNEPQSLRRAWRRSRLHGGFRRVRRFFVVWLAAAVRAPVPR
jgi:SAM-dependent methyltransferase